MVKQAHEGNSLTKHCAAIEKKSQHMPHAMRQKVTEVGMANKINKTEGVNL